MTLNYGNCAKKHAPIAKQLNKFEKLPNIFHLQYDSSILLDENEMKMKIKIIIIFWVLYFFIMFQHSITVTVRKNMHP